MKTYVLTEGPADVAFLQRVIKGKVEGPPEFVAAGGKSAVTSMAQSLIVSRRAPVAVVLDADTLDPELVLEQERIYSDRLGAYSQGVPFRFFFAVPEIDNLLFESPVLLGNELGIQVSRQDASESIVHPRQVLERLIKRSPFKSRQELFINLTENSVKELARLPLVDALVSFLRKPHRLEAWHRAQANRVA
jgi:hypothetical protein